MPVLSVSPSLRRFAESSVAGFVTCWISRSVGPPIFNVRGEEGPANENEFLPLHVLFFPADRETERAMVEEKEGIFAEVSRDPVEVGKQPSRFRYQRARFVWQGASV